MNKIEHLLTCLTEECAEIQKLACKANRFGLDDSYVDGPTNRENLVTEINDLMAVVDLLAEEGAFKCDVFNMNKIDAKKNKVRKYMGYAKKVGTLK